VCSNHNSHSFPSAYWLVHTIPIYVPTKIRTQIAVDIPEKTEVHGVSLSAVGDENGDVGFECVLPSGSGRIGRKMLSLSSAKYRLCFDGRNTHGRATSSHTVWSRSINRPRSLVHNSKHKRAQHVKSFNSKPCCLFTKNDCCLLGQIYCTAFT
jgi:hypothetical protein